MATCYGEELAGTPPTSGEPRAPNGCTALTRTAVGHRTLSGYDGKNVVVVANDRRMCGPDRSWVAAQQIGLADAGAAVVDTEVL